MSENIQNDTTSSDNTDILENIDILSDASTEKTVGDTPLLPWDEAQNELPSDEVSNTSQTSHSTPTGEINTDNTGDEEQFIDIDSLEKLIEILSSKSYDYVIVEPQDLKVKVTFREGSINKNISYVKFSSYTNILLKIKQTAGLVVENTGNSQEGNGKISIGEKAFTIATKTAPGENGERIWLKVKEYKQVKTVKKASLTMILGFLGAILFVMLILGGSFISFVVLNAKTVDDVKFFASLGINLNDINSFISQVVTVIFSIVLFILTTVLSISLFKFFLTKKVFKKKKILYGFISGFLLFTTFATGSAWMIVDQKIKQLPNWQEEAYGDLKIFDNNLLVNKDFSVNDALIAQTDNLIGPISLNLDLSNFQNSQLRKGLDIKSYTWKIGNSVTETFTPVLIKELIEAGNYNFTVSATGIDSNGKEVTQELTNIPRITLSHSIIVEETITNNGGKKVSFDASSLKNTGNVEWYFKDPSSLEKKGDYPEWTSINQGFVFIPGKIFFEEMYVGISIIDSGGKPGDIQKVIIIRPDGISEISGKIAFEQSVDDDLEYSFFIEVPKTSFSNGFIEQYIWKIAGASYTVAGNNTAEVSPSIKHLFTTFGEQEIEVELIDSAGESQILKSKVNIQKNIELKDSLIITDRENQEVSDIRYEKKSHEYFINNLGIPAVLKFDARYIRPTSISYTLEKVEWNIEDNTDIEGTGKNFVFDIPVEGNQTLTVSYTFIHRKNKDDIITLKEYIYVEAIKKDAILDLKMEYDSNYAPVNVRFDASKSFIKNDDIIKFSYDYGDGISEERDAINPGHRYAEAGDYTVTLTVTGKTGKTYTTQKKLILLPTPQGVKISPSLKKAPVGQGIDFSSAESAGQITEYFWDFGDGNISTEANPTHSYKKPGYYTVELKADFVNKNSIADKIEIEIVALEEE